MHYQTEETGGEVSPSCDKANYGRRLQLPQEPGLLLQAGTIVWVDGISPMHFERQLPPLFIRNRVDQRLPTARQEPGHPETPQDSAAKLQWTGENWRHRSRTA